MKHPARLFGLGLSLVLAVSFLKTTSTPSPAPTLPTNSSPGHNSSPVPNLPSSSLPILDQAQAQNSDFIPTLINIPKINLTAPIIPVGYTPDGKRTAVPEDKSTVGWWDKGTQPGKTGSAVLVGHNRLTDQSPGVFLNLYQLQKGDQLHIKSSHNLTLTFIVTQVKSYPVADFPLQKIYAQKDARRLNLVTCHGTYSPDAKDYSHRLVIYTTLLAH